MIDKELIRDRARELGFDVVRFTDAEDLTKDGEVFKQWLEEGNHADMEWLERNADKRCQPREVVPGAKAVICLGMNYCIGLDGVCDGEIQDEADAGKVARYAWGRDYHKVISKKMKVLVKWLNEKWPGHDHKAYVDTGPVLERALAAKAGVGFVGKNTLVITKDFGSWVFLSEVITTLEIEPDELQPPFGSCGSCRKCIDACPTGALSEYKLDARKCIAYHTIENRGEIPAEIADKLSGYVFGCDICQQVCPHNCRAQKTREEAFKMKIAGAKLNLDEVLAIKDKEEFDERFAGSPVRRAKLEGLQRNARILKSEKTS